MNSYYAITRHRYWLLKLNYKHLKNMGAYEDAKQYQSKK